MTNENQQNSALSFNALPSESAVETGTEAGAEAGANGRNRRGPAAHFWRIAGSSVPAAGITFGLFLVMGSLIAAEFAPIEASESREITSIIPEEAKPDEFKPHTPVKLLETIAAPPPQIKYSVTKSDVDLPPTIPLGEAPAHIEPGPVPVIPVLFVETDTHAKPLRPPVPTYPSRALMNNIEGQCEVKFDVNVSGRPYNIHASCTENIFKRAAEKAVSEVQFALKTKAGKAIERRNVIYPIVFSLT